MCKIHLWYHFNYSNHVIWFNEISSGLTKIFLYYFFLFLFFFLLWQINLQKFQFISPIKLEWTEEGGMPRFCHPLLKVLTRIIHIAVTWTFFTQKTAAMKSIRFPRKSFFALNRTVWERNLYGMRKCVIKIKLHQENV